jgi:hypothetical protein
MWQGTQATYARSTNQELATITLTLWHVSQQSSEQSVMYEPPDYMTAGNALIDGCYAVTQYTCFNNRGGDVFYVVGVEVM